MNKNKKFGIVHIVFTSNLLLWFPFKDTILVIFEVLFFSQLRHNSINTLNLIFSKQNTNVKNEKSSIYLIKSHYFIK